MALDYSNLYQGYLKASTYSSVDRKMVKRALAPYKINADTIQRQQASDAELRRMAVQAVLKKYRTSK